MIYTITFNPSLDYTVTVDDYVHGSTNRSRNEHILIGGKGINVSAVLKNLGVESSVLGFTAGFTGEQIERGLEKQGLSYDFIRLNSGFSRINVKIKGSCETEINGSGPDISEREVNLLKTKLSRLRSGDYLVLAGSVPRSVPNTVYSDISAEMAERGVNVIADASGELLLNLLKYRPFLIKPNNYELEELFAVRLGSDKDKIAHYAARLQEMGAQNVIVSMAGDGAVMLTSDGNTIYADAPKGKVKNSVGAGDSMVAGFLCGWLEVGDYLHAFKMSIAAGSASAFSEELAAANEIMKIYKSLKI